jgi:hypothetical protein
MDQERNLGVTEARFALTLLTCLLVAIGYIALLRLGGTKDVSLDVNADDGASPIIAGPATPPPITADPVPRELPLEKPDDRRIERTSQLLKLAPPVQQPPESERR